MRLLRILPHRWHQIAREATKFAVIGGINTAVDIIIWNALLAIGPLKAKIVSTVVATTLSYLMNRYWTFNTRERSAAHREYLLFFGRIHPDKGTAEAIEVARRSSRRLVLAGIIQDRAYFEQQIEPHLDGDRVRYAGSVGPAERDALLGGAYALLHLIAFDEPFALPAGLRAVSVERGAATVTQ